MKIVVDRDLCEGYGRCADVAPAVFELRDDDQMYVLDENSGEGQRPGVEAAVANCPRQALSLRD